MNSTQDNITLLRRLTGDCPLCRAPIALRTNRQKSTQFLGCSNYPDCSFTEPINQAMLQDAGYNSLVEAHYEHAREVAKLQTQIMDLHRTVASLAERGYAKTQTHPRVTDRDLKALITLCHPDKWDGHPLSNEITVQLNGLRQRAKGARA